jgi:hypothetical protein
MDCVVCRFDAIRNRSFVNDVEQVVLLDFCYYNPERRVERPLSRGGQESLFSPRHTTPRFGVQRAKMCQRTMETGDFGKQRPAEGQHKSRSRFQLDQPSANGI